MIEMEEHDHDLCVTSVLERAEDICQAKGVRLTEQRRNVLAVLAQSHVPASAYDILDIMNRDGGRLAPVAIYRALDFLSQQGLIHRIESRNAYVACSHCGVGHGDVTVFLLCDECSKAGEFHSDALSGLVETISRTENFKAHAPVLEIRGTCQQCNQDDPDQSAR